MNENKDKLKEWMSSLTTDSLKKIIEVDFNDYEGYAIEMAKEELSSRKDYIETNESVCIEKFTTFMDLIKAAEFKSVKNAISTIYSEQLLFIEKYNEVYALLLQLKPNEENVDYLNIDNKDSHWKVSGEDANTGENYGVGFFVWADWLSFLVKNEQIYDIGKENYIAICLMTLTQYGFTEEEIQRNFSEIEKVKQSESADEEPYSNGLPINEYKDITLNKTLERVSDIKHEFLEKLSEEHELLQVRPWIRLWARSIDNFIIGLILWYTWFLIIPNFHALNSSYIWNYVFSLLDFFIWALFEAYFISKGGYTPGKWVLNTKVQDVNGGNLSYQKALKRVILILLYGEGLLIPFVSYIFNFASYHRLMGKGITK